MFWKTVYFLSTLKKWDIKFRNNFKVIGFDERCTLLVAQWINALDFQLKSSGSKVVGRGRALWILSWNIRISLKSSRNDELCINLQEIRYYFQRRFVNCVLEWAEIVFRCLALIDIANFAQPLWRNGLVGWTSNSKVVGSSPIEGDRLVSAFLYFYIEITSWLVNAYDFYSRVVKDR